MQAAVVQWKIHDDDDEDDDDEEEEKAEEEEEEDGVADNDEIDFPSETSRL